MNPITATSTDTTRRQWVKQFLLGTASVLCGSASTTSLLAQVGSTGPGPGVLRLKLANLPALATTGGSIQLRFIDYIAPMTINRVSATRFVTLDSVCTHAGCTVARFIVDSNRMRCPCHGSRYDIEGRVFRDANGESTEPASDDLGRYVTTFDPATGIIAITIPTLALHIESITVQNLGTGDAKRIKLVFPASYGATYEIYSQPDLITSPAIIPFSLHSNGTAQMTSYNSETEGNLTVYIDSTAPRNFYSVGIKLSPP